MQEKGAIISFRGDHRFLSNFWVCDVEHEGNTYKSSEHAFQAAKCTVRAEHDEIAAAKTPRKAKILGGKYCLRDDWEQIKAQIMWKIVQAKFEQNYTLRQKLLQTGDLVLVEGNKWHDNVFGVCYCDNCNGHGLNLLGRTLMYVRDQLRHAERLGKREWAPDEGNPRFDGYKNCLVLWCPEAGRKGAIWEMDNGVWRWDVGHERGRARTMLEAQGNVEMYCEE